LGDRGWGMEVREGARSSASAPTPNPQPPTPNVVAVYPMDDDVVNRARCPSKIPQLMALGLPLVAEGVGEIRSYMAGLERACLVEPGDDEGFRRLVESLLSSADRRARLGKRLQRAAEQWRWERLAAGLLPWYESALNR